MLLRIVQFLPLLLIGQGLLLGGGSVAYRIVRKSRLTPMARGQTFFWGSLGFWSLVIGAFMIGEQLLQ